MFVGRKHTQMEKNSKTLKNLKGYCIICCKDLPLNQNMPFCSDCYSPYKNAKPSLFIKGFYCHSCGNKDKSISNCEPLCKECEPFNRDDNSIDDYYLEKINEYKSISLSELQKIKPIWTCGESLRFNDFKHKVVLKELRINEVLEIIESKGILNTTEVFSNEPKSNRRIMNILRAWKKGIPIEPPCIIYDDSIYFSDGRHRSLAAHFLGADTIMVYCITPSESRRD